MTVANDVAATNTRVMVIPIRMLNTHDVRYLLCSVRELFGLGRWRIAILDVTVIAAYAPTAKVASVIRIQWGRDGGDPVFPWSMSWVLLRNITAARVAPPMVVRVRQMMS